VEIWQNGDVANFSIYIHSAPGFEFDGLTSRSSFFRGRELKNSIQVTFLYHCLLFNSCLLNLLVLASVWLLRKPRKSK
jgi:hypothetical protein